MKKFRVTITVLRVGGRTEVGRVVEAEDCRGAIAEAFHVLEDLEESFVSEPRIMKVMVHPYYPAPEVIGYQQSTDTVMTG